MSRIHNAIDAAISGDLAEFRKIMQGELYARSIDEVASRRIVIAQEMFAEGNGEDFRTLHSVQKMDEPFVMPEKDGKPTGITKAPKRPADGDNPGNPKLTD
jgi:hypothetical protein